MALIDAKNAGPIPRTPQGKGALYGIFGQRFNDKAKWWSFMRTQVLPAMRQAPINPKRTEIEDVAAMTTEIKQMTTELGAAIVGIAEYNPNLVFQDAEELEHKYVVVFALPMAYDVMVDIGPKSQEDVHKVYFLLDEIGTRLAHRIGAFGYSARVQPNQGEIPLPAYGQLAGLGELGKHGSLISPELGSAFRLSAVSTDMPLIADGPKDHGIDEICSNCDICTRFCPGSAIKPQKTEAAGIRRWQVDAPACHPHFLRMFGCKICLSVCPMNARGNQKSLYKPVAKDIRKAKNAAGMLKLITERSNLEFDDFNRALDKLSHEDRQLEWWGKPHTVDPSDFEVSG